MNRIVHESTRRHATVATTIGELLAVADGDVLTGLYFPAHRYPPAPDSIGGRVEASDDDVFSRLAKQLEAYFDGRRRAFDIAVHTSGDELSERVWALLREIPFGETTTYGALAARLGNPHLAQRVGQCVGHNPISIVIPCHRVLGADGSLTGFAGGLERKRFLLDLEEPEHVRAGRLF
ncbi:methylated-DNA--[protein]-cysteine S-methyltransferase [Pseudoclavibacter chungangensis]|uniref:Methylated-DNA--protein-cysteine methyltransferase n=1 Tax=Pseudoclavibacter chungangensis TaxID=587635 RepID=A0A7J5C2J0_9MICO|nr:methylated-DNA--[protein]-cysteine S-methyltransferase [Pseudoclavibacter chungangensis]KAB1660263.1 methylated-DNA--[protein]-cysteine S-methyltransferase [Pseudoclavibacter chungangensis]NYJ65608.1 methylated-DNA-[protein]-cysteine S-methyltransferase [Pseudoclavibacter chungangensis]